MATPALVSALRARSENDLQLSITAILPQIRKHIFETRIANALLAFSGSLDAPGEAIGFALYFFNFSTWTGRPGLYVRYSFGKHVDWGQNLVFLIARRPLRKTRAQE